MYRKLKHPNIVGYIGSHLNNDEQKLYIFLEYVPGGSIASMLERFGQFSEDVARTYARQVRHGNLIDFSSYVSGGGGSMLERVGQIREDVPRTCAVVGEEWSDHVLPVGWKVET